MKAFPNLLLRRFRIRHGAPVELMKNEFDVFPVVMIDLNKITENMLRLLIPTINLDEYITITPYSFVDDNGKTRKGVTVTQGDVKLQNYFYDAEKKKNLHKYPEPEGDTNAFDKDDWKIYFTKCRKFLVKNVEDKFLPAFEHMKPTITGGSVDYPEDDAKADVF
jgi:hypothetical protein